MHSVRTAYCMSIDNNNITCIAQYIHTVDSGVLTGKASAPSVMSLVGLHRGEDLFVVLNFGLFKPSNTNRSLPASEYGWEAAREFR